METYNRQFLQEYRGMRAQWLNQEPRIVSLILREASGGHTRYMIPGNCFVDPFKKENIAEWVVSRLKQRFPDVLVEYRHATELNGNVQHGIFVDWS